VKPTANVDETITCVSCLAQNEQSTPFCHNCGAPVGRSATIDPLQTIQTEGYLLRKALEGRPRPVVFLGLLILHLPVLAVGIGVAVYMIFNGHGWPGFIFFWAGMGLSYFASVVLYRAIKNYLTMRKRP
jgi:hypothetical protein